MADEREEKPGDNDNPTPIGGHRAATEESANADDGGGMSGQPIGGNDSNTGSGTTLTAGYTPPSRDPQNSDDLEEPAGAAATAGSDFANQGRGATEDESDEA